LITGRSFAATNMGAVKGVGPLTGLKRFRSYKLLNTRFIISLCFVLRGNFLAAIFWFYHPLTRGILIYSSSSIIIGPRSVQQSWYWLTISYSIYATAGLTLQMCTPFGWTILETFCGLLIPKLYCLSFHKVSVPLLLPSGSSSSILCFFSILLLSCAWNA
jgi:hypothetical protein